MQPPAVGGAGKREADDDEDAQVGGVGGDGGRTRGPQREGAAQRHALGQRQRFDDDPDGAGQLGDGEEGPGEHVQRHDQHPVGGGDMALHAYSDRPCRGRRGERVMQSSGTHLEFRVYNGSENMNGTPLYADNNIADSASGFFTSSSATCSGSSYYNMANYQEVHHLANGLSIPTDDFFFGYTTLAWYGGTSWVDTGLPNSAFSQTCFGTSCPTLVQSYYFLYYGGSSARILEIANEPFRDYFTSDLGSVTTGGHFAAAGTEAAQGSDCNGGLSFCPTLTTCYFPLVRVQPR